MFKIIFALMVLVNVAVFLWPGGDKAPFFDSRSDDTLPTIKADKMLLLTETVMTDRTATSSPALAQPSESQPAESSPSGSGTQKTPVEVVAPEPTTPVADKQPAALPQVDVAVTPITLPSLSNERKDKTKTPESSKSSKQPAASESSPVPDKAKDEPKKKTETKVASKTKDKAEADKAKTEKSESRKPEAKKPEAKKAKPADKVVVAKAAPAPVSGVCVRIGPFAKDENLEAAASLVTGFGAAFTQRTVPSRDVRTWRVYAGPFTSEQETFDKDAVLAIEGYTDRYVMNDLNGQKFISLGVFSAENSATALSERLAGLPMAINIRPEIRQLNPTKWLEVAAPGLRPTDQSSLESHAWPTRRVQVKPINCRPASG